ncbi:hypothetical protein FH972_014855 [Carpinus fangiana]|uniref:Wall-associated receptor kinase galacturonan-binding domain-containing protein n=1 Tax=Carpinus fangiana TaxID=176857 RepID=A0A5N6REL8_9ROSI|nr:hypothetical protein FH972_014855 [Carpinus fangiana]
MSSCKPSCGDFSPKYPFGIGAGCYANDWFEVVCRNDYLDFLSPKPFLRILNLELLSISLAGTVHVNFPTVYNCTNSTSSTANIMELRNSPFIFSQSENRFIAMGCNNFASMGSVDGSGSVIGECMSICDMTKVINASVCNGINCCQTTIPSDLDSFSTTMEVMNSKDLVIGQWIMLLCILGRRKVVQHLLRHTSGSENPTSSIAPQPETTNAYVWVAPLGTVLAQGGTSDGAMLERALDPLKVGGS